MRIALCLVQCGRKKDRRISVSCSSARENRWCFIILILLPFALLHAFHRPTKALRWLMASLVKEVAWPDLTCPEQQLCCNENHPETDLLFHAMIKKGWSKIPAPLYHFSRPFTKKTTIVEHIKSLKAMANKWPGCTCQDSGWHSSLN